eukprot:7029287-Pyramimonas_sp.AAC.1
MQRDKHPDLAAPCLRHALRFFSAPFQPRARRARRSLSAEPRNATPSPPIVERLKRNARARSR